MINWEIGKAYRTRKDCKYVLSKVTDRLVGNLYNPEGSLLYENLSLYLTGNLYFNDRDSDLNIIGEWDEPGADPFAYKSPQANKTYTMDEYSALGIKAYKDLIERKAPPTLISSPTYRDFNFDWGDTAKTLEILRNDFNNANMLARDNKPDDRRARVSLINKQQQRRAISQSILTGYRYTKAKHRRITQLWGDLVRLRATDKIIDNAESIAWYDKV